MNWWHLNNGKIDFYKVFLEYWRDFRVNSAFISSLLVLAISAYIHLARVIYSLSTIAVGESFEPILKTLLQESCKLIP